MTTLKMLFVDLDGTLADSIPLLYHFYQAFLARYGKEGNVDDFQRLNGPTIPEVVRILKQIYALQEPVEQLLQTYEQILLDGYAKETPLAPYAKETLLNLRRQGVNLGLVTAAKKTLADAFLKSHGMDDWFAFVCAGDHLIKGKPDPEIYEKAVLLAGCEKPHICVIEDSENGVKAALAADLAVIQIDLRQQKPQIAGNWKEIYQRLKRYDELSDYSAEHTF